MRVRFIFPCILLALPLVASAAPSLGPVGVPYCADIGMQNEGWVMPLDNQSTAVIRYAQCSTCIVDCEQAGTGNEGWYAKCSNNESGLITFAQCANTGLQSSSDEQASASSQADSSTGAIHLQSSVSDTSSVSATSFTDVTSDTPYATAIAYVQAQGIVNGYADGTFRPDVTINRAEFTKIVTLATLGQQANTCTAPSAFSDVPADAWFAVYVCSAAQAHLITGYPDGSFRPDQPITFVEAAKIIMLANSGNGTTVFLDTGGPWYERYVQELASSNDIPVSINSFDHQITRGEMAEMIWRLRANVSTEPSLTYDQLQAANQ